MVLADKEQFCVIYDPDGGEQGIAKEDVSVAEREVQQQLAADESWRAGAADVLDGEGLSEVLEEDSYWADGQGVAHSRAPPIRA